MAKATPTPSNPPPAPHAPHNNPPLLARKKPHTHTEEGEREREREVPVEMAAAVCAVLLPDALSYLDEKK